MAQIAGTRILAGGSSPGTYITSTRRVRDVSNTIWQLDPNNASLTTLLRNLRKMKVTDVKFEWYEDIFPVQTDTSTTDDSTLTDTSITMTTGTYARQFDLWYNSDSGEIVMVVNATPAATWTVVRGVGSTAADVDTGDVWYYIGNAQPTGQGARQKITTTASAVYNYCQIFKEGWEITRTADATKLYGGPDRSYLRSKHGDLHNRDIERGFWFGGRDDIDYDDNALVPTMAYTTGGVFYYLTTNVEANAGGSMSEDEFEAILEGSFRYGNSTKFMFCSPRACTVIDSWGRGKLQLVPRDTTYGINISRYISSHGELNIIMNRLFYDFANVTAADSATPYNYGKCSCILDLEDLGYRYLIDTELATGIQGNDEDTLEDQYRTQCGLFLKNEAHHTEIHNWSLS